MIYLDANASEPLRPRALQAAVAAMEAAGNPSSIHAAGRAARRVLEEARENLSARFKSRPQDIVFTSGATEANALAVHALGQNRAVLIGATEHDAVREAAPGATVIPVNRDGQIEAAALEALLDGQAGALVCLMAANNETGVLHDLPVLAEICARFGALLHVDAAQAAGRLPADWLGMGAVSVAVSGHKAGGPMGAGALILAPAFAETLRPMLKGGGQEKNRRGGTPALPAIAGMAAALCDEYNALRIFAYRAEIEEFCASLGAEVAGSGAARLPNTSCLVQPGMRADMQLIALDLAGIAVSAGAACSSGKLAASHVLSAMGYGEQAGQAIRVSLPWNIEASWVTAFKDAYRAMLKHALHGQSHRPTETLTQV